MIFGHARTNQGRNNLIYLQKSSRSAKAYSLTGCSRIQFMNEVIEKWNVVVINNIQAAIDPIRLSKSSTD